MLRIGAAHLFSSEEYEFETHSGIAMRFRIIRYLISCNKAIEIRSSFRATYFEVCR